MAPAKIGEPAKGKTLVNDRGMTLYVFDKDKDVPGKSACNGICAENWPVLLASDADKAAGLTFMVAGNASVNARDRTNPSHCYSTTDINERIDCLEGTGPASAGSVSPSTNQQKQSRTVPPASTVAPRAATLLHQRLASVTNFRRLMGCPSAED